MTYEMINEFIYMSVRYACGSIHAKYSNAAAVVRGCHKLGLGWAISFHIQGSIAEFGLL